MLTWEVFKVCLGSPPTGCGSLALVTLHPISTSANLKMIVSPSVYH